jgi:SAM-dependent methyltransferase
MMRSQSQESRYLEFTPDVIQNIANSRLKHPSLAKIFIHQVFTENWLRYKKKINFRKRKNDEARSAYCEMSLVEFEGINARQQWANWRTIPKSLSGLLPDRPLAAIDLCCGVGHSTEVLACYLPLGSKILGIDFNPSFIYKARFRSYLHRSEKECDVSFRAQSVLDPFKDDKDELVPSGSIDLINSSGAVGSHFDRSATEVLAKEISRVLKVGGLAMIDSGLPGTRSSTLVQIFKDHGFEVCQFMKSHPLDIFTQVCFRKNKNF